MSIQANNIDPIQVRQKLKEAIKITNEGSSKEAMELALKMMKAYDNALNGFRDLNAKALNKIRELSQLNRP